MLQDKIVSHSKVEARCRFSLTYIFIPQIVNLVMICQTSLHDVDTISIARLEVRKTFAGRTCVHLLDCCQTFLRGGHLVIIIIHFYFMLITSVHVTKVTCYITSAPKHEVVVNSLLGQIKVKIYCKHYSCKCQLLRLSNSSLYVNIKSFTPTILMLCLVRNSKAAPLLH